MAFKATCRLESISPLSFSRHYSTPKLEKESFSDYETRTWRDRCHENEDGNIFIPPMAYKNGLAEAAKFRSQKIPGKRNATYTKHFEAGVLVLEPLVLPIKKVDVASEVLFVPSDGKRGGGSRVEKTFPLVPKWEGDVVFHILDDTITKDVFEETLGEFGNFIGIGRFRPRNNGYYGRFRVVSVKWEKASAAGQE
jgi:hypothetical protein